uniref:Uncharacterized protein n=1 Tax=Anguilla anguilla TaxID=7936 RepID=A0A0E9Y0D6_ANGAN
MDTNYKKRTKKNSVPYIMPYSKNMVVDARFFF